MPAGSLIFPDDSATLVALEAAGEAAGVFFERGLGLPPPGTQLDEAPRVAILVDSASPVESDTSWSLRQIFGPDVGFVSVASGANSLQNAATDPLESFDVIYNAGQTYPTGNTARARLRAFFERGGGYIATSQSASNFAFLTGAHPALIRGNLTQGSDGAGGGIALWDNVRSNGPLTGGYPMTDNLFIPADVTLVLVPADGRNRGRPVPVERQLDVRRRPLARPRPEGGERADHRARHDPCGEPLHGSRHESVLAGRRRARVAADRPGGAVVEPDRRVAQSTTAG